MQPENPINNIVQMSRTQIMVRYVGEIPNSKIIKAYTLKIVVIRQITKAKILYLKDLI